MKASEKIIVDSVIRWFEQAVLGLNLCPFAHRPYQQHAIHFELSDARDDSACLGDLYLHLRELDHNPAIETLIMICPYHLQQFADYNQFLSLADKLLYEEGWSGVYQIASFHPDYQFADAPAADKANWTNRSPYPLFHLIRESMLSAAIQSHPDPEGIPERNITTLRGLSDENMKQIFGTRYHSESG
ncbi:MAG: DUF1415 domain-containing protein [Gammaproteobacteria bacterium]|nr:DUF1415 domain-containing protein [Gammaproteobacteria bacterium]